MTDIPNQIEEDVPYIKLSKISDDESPVDFNQRLSKKLVFTYNYFYLFFYLKRQKIQNQCLT